MRRAHTKSRNGCKECKQRKVKCDEARPSCARCAAAKRQCLYLGSSNQAPSPPITLPVSSTQPIASPAQSASTNDPGIGLATYLGPATSSRTSTQLPDSFLEERYSLGHLELLHHVKSHLVVDKLFAQSHLSAFLDLLLKEALKTPYLMDELLAFAAAHKSTTCNDGQLYHVEATRLQTRALNQFNVGQMEVTEQNCMAVFTFSALLGQHSLFDAFSSMTDLSTVLDKLTHCISLHRGIRAIAGESWERIHSLLQEQASIDLAHMAVDIPTTSGIECDGLLQRLQSADISQRTIAHYEQAVKILQYLFDSSKTSESRRLAACQEFLVRVSGDYISLLERRQPEALVIISYYGVLLHQAKDYWTIGDSGRFLINAVSGHLGTYWADWLVWPNEALE